MSETLAPHGIEAFNQTRVEQANASKLAAAKQDGDASVMERLTERQKKSSEWFANNLEKQRETLESSDPTNPLVKLANKVEALLDPQTTLSTEKINKTFSELDTIHDDLKDELIALKRKRQKNPDNDQIKENYLQTYRKILAVQSLLKQVNSLIDNTDKNAISNSDSEIESTKEKTGSEKEERPSENFSKLLTDATGIKADLESLVMESFPDRPTRDQVLDYFVRFQKLSNRSNVIKTDLGNFQQSNQFNTLSNDDKLQMSSITDEVEHNYSQLEQLSRARAELLHPQLKNLIQLANRFADFGAVEQRQGKAKAHDYIIKVQELQAELSGDERYKKSLFLQRLITSAIDKINTTPLKEGDTKLEKQLLKDVHNYTDYLGAVFGMDGRGNDTDTSITRTFLEGLVVKTMNDYDANMQKDPSWSALVSLAEKHGIDTKNTAIADIQTSSFYDDKLSKSGWCYDLLQKTLAGDEKNLVESFLPYLRAKENGLQLINVIQRNVDYGNFHNDMVGITKGIDGDNTKKDSNGNFTEMRKLAKWFDIRRDAEEQSKALNAIGLFKSEEDWFNWVTQTSRPPEQKQPEEQDKNVGPAQEMISVIFNSHVAKRGDKWCGTALFKNEAPGNLGGAFDATFGATKAEFETKYQIAKNDTSLSDNEKQQWERIYNEVHYQLEDMFTAIRQVVLFKMSRDDLATFAVYKFEAENDESLPGDTPKYSFSRIADVLRDMSKSPNVGKGNMLFAGYLYDLSQVYEETDYFKNNNPIKTNFESIPEKIKMYLWTEFPQIFGFHFPEELTKNKPGKEIEFKKLNEKRLHVESVNMEPFLNAAKENPDSSVRPPLHDEFVYKLKHWYLTGVPPASMAMNRKSGSATTWLQAEAAMSTIMDAAIHGDIGNYEKTISTLNSQGSIIAGWTGNGSPLKVRELEKQYGSLEAFWQHRGQEEPNSKDPLLYVDEQFISLYMAYLTRVLVGSPRRPVHELDGMGKQYYANQRATLETVLKGIGEGKSLNKNLYLPIIGNYIDKNYDQNSVAKSNFNHPMEKALKRLLGPIKSADTLNDIQNLIYGVYLRENGHEKDTRGRDNQVTTGFGWGSGAITSMEIDNKRKAPYRFFIEDTNF